jgi:hypothetical protein
MGFEPNGNKFYLFCPFGFFFTERLSAPEISKRAWPLAVEVRALVFAATVAGKKEQHASVATVKRKKEYERKRRKKKRKKEKEYGKKEKWII